MKRGQGRHLPRVLRASHWRQMRRTAWTNLSRLRFRRTAVVLVVAPQFRVEHLLLVFQWRVQMFSTPCGDSEEPAPRDLAAEGQIQAVLALAPDRLSRRYAYQVLLIEDLGLRCFSSMIVAMSSAEGPKAPRQNSSRRSLS